ncbi:LysR family transcriptional regulator [Vibrio agarivorans]|uniref:LysR family transcriptional regulator n=1 Tax=Vibrio agarivorans TaxID=153622 RepID=A0ABT7Y478_9VIBR|nr:LysR family transcriptional regulator [Vibrio agarivorans]MDN2482780.1 LysR family transcriptional regulator [Vibrio agarivorans]
MAKDLFLNLDLNLLRTFLVLYQELNMRKASQRLFVSQPALSQALKKLRHHFDDELFVKVPSGLESTPFGHELASYITPHLEGLADALNRTKRFEPHNINYPIKIALSSTLMSCVGGLLFSELKKVAPQANIELLTWNTNTPEAMLKDEVTIGFHYDFTLLQGLSSVPIGEVEGIALVRKAHPLANKQFVTLNDLSQYPLASLVNSGWNDHFAHAVNLAQIFGLELEVGIRSESLQVLIDVTEASDMFIGHANLFPITKYPSLTALKFHVEDQFKKQFTMPVHGHFHKKNINNPLIEWLNSEMTELLQQQVEQMKPYYSH